VDAEAARFREKGFECLLISSASGEGIDDFIELAARQALHVKI
jgi:hypothetical protein